METKATKQSPTLMLYREDVEVLMELPEGERAKVINAYFAWYLSGERPKEAGMLKAFVSMMINKQVAQSERYFAVCDKRAAAGRKSGQLRAKKNEQRTHVNFVEQNEHIQTNHKTRQDKTNRSSNQPSISLPCGKARDEDGWTDGEPSYTTDGRTDGWTDAEPSYTTDGRTDGWTDGADVSPEDGWTDGEPSYTTGGRTDAELFSSLEWLDDGYGCFAAEKLKVCPEPLLEPATAIIVGDGSGVSRKTFKRLYHDIGNEAYRDELSEFASELNQGIEPKCRAAALVARMKDRIIN